MPNTTTPLEERKTVEVCYAPSHYSLYGNNFDVVVVIDVLRATSAITTALHAGVKEIIPVATVEEAIQYKKNGYIVAAERDGKVVEGFDFGNSPYAFMNPEMVGKSVVLTTTNGTKAIQTASEKTVIIACLNNLSVVCEYLIQLNKNVLVLASGWKEKMNLEDTICAGAIADHLIETKKFTSNEDSTLAAKFIFRSARDNMYTFLRSSSHRRRLMQLKIQKDVKYCLMVDTVPCIPILKNGKLVLLENHES
jgi:2-phosphosulfolactate phosphatase